MSMLLWMEMFRDCLTRNWASLVCMMDLVKSCATIRVTSSTHTYVPGEGQVALMYNHTFFWLNVQAHIRAIVENAYWQLVMSRCTFFKTKLHHFEVVFGPFFCHRGTQRKHKYRWKNESWFCITSVDVHAWIAYATMGASASMQYCYAHLVHRVGIMQHVWQVVGFFFGTFVK